MKRIARTALLVCVGAVISLSGCTAATDTGSERGRATPGPTATTTVVPRAAERTAERYRQSGGDEEVYGVQQTSGPDGVPLLVVWTRNPDESARTFDVLKGSVTAYMNLGEGLSLKRGYFMDVYGPDGSLQHRLDARA